MRAGGRVRKKPRGGDRGRSYCQLRRRGRVADGPAPLRRRHVRCRGRRRWSVWRRAGRHGSRTPPVRRRRCGEGRRGARVGTRLGVGVTGSNRRRHGWQGRRGRRGADSSGDVRGRPEVDAPIGAVRPSRIGCGAAECRRRQRPARRCRRCRSPDSRWQRGVGGSLPRLERRRERPLRRRARSGGRPLRRGQRRRVLRRSGDGWRPTVASTIHRSRNASSRIERGLAITMGVAPLLPRRRLRAAAHCASVPAGRDTANAALPQPRKGDCLAVRRRQRQRPPHGCGGRRGGASPQRLRRARAAGAAAPVRDVRRTHRRRQRRVIQRGECRGRRRGRREPRLRPCRRGPARGRALLLRAAGSESRSHDRGREERQLIGRSDYRR